MFNVPSLIRLVNNIKISKSNNILKEYISNMSKRLENNDAYEMVVVDNVYVFKIRIKSKRREWSCQIILPIQYVYHAIGHHMATSIVKNHTR